MRSLWIITAALVVIGVALMAGGVAAGLGPIAFVGGVLMLWSGVVKAIVLRIWRTILDDKPAAERSRAGTESASTIGQES